MSVTSCRSTGRGTSSCFQNRCQIEPLSGVREFYSCDMDFTTRADTANTEFLRLRFQNLNETGEGGEYVFESMMRSALATVVYAHYAAKMTW